MSRKLFLKFIGNSYRTVFCAIMLSALMLAMTGCPKISGKQAQAENDARPSKSDNPAGTNVEQLTGKWHKKQSGRFDYASYAENLGNFESYEITEDGRVRLETLNAARNYDCIVETSAKSAGTIDIVSDSQISISLDGGTIRRTNTCSPEKNSTDSAGAARADYQWKLGADEAGRAELCLTQTDGQTACYRREE